MSQTQTATETGKKPYQRKIIRINPKFQFRIALYVGSWLIALSFIYPWVVHSLFDYFVQYAQMDPMGPSVKSLLETRNSVLSLMVATQLAFIALCFLGSLFLAHRLAGPVYRTRKHLKMVAGGDLSEEIHLRKYDHFRDLADDFNAMLRSLRLRHDNCAGHIDQAMSLTADPKVKEQLQSALNSLQSK